MFCKKNQHSNLVRSRPDQCNQLHENKKSKYKPSCKSRRETHDNYAYEIVRVDRFRIISCKDNIQWIIQKQNSGTRSKDRITWKAISFHRSRSSLICVWRNKTKQDVPSEVLMLPERYSQFVRD